MIIPIEKEDAADKRASFGKINISINIHIPLHIPTTAVEIINE